MIKVQIKFYGLTILLILSMLLVIGCRSADSTSKTIPISSTLSEEVKRIAQQDYICTWPDLPAGIKETGYIANWQRTRESLYVQISQPSESTGEGEQAVYQVYQYDLSSNECQPITTTSGGQALLNSEPIYFLGADKEDTVFFVFPTQLQPGKMDVWTLNQSEHEPKVWLTFPKEFSPQLIYMDENGFFYLCAPGEIYVLDHNGQMQSEIKNADFTGQLILVGEQIYALSTSAPTDQPSKAYICQVNKEKKQLEKGVFLSEDAVKAGIYSIGTYLCYNGQEGIKWINPVSGQEDYLIRWEQAGLLFGTQNRQAIFYPQGNQFLLIGEGAIPGMYYPAVLRLTPTNEPVQRGASKIVLAGIDISDNLALIKAVLDYNLAHPDATISIKDYGLNLEGDIYDSKRQQQLQQQLTEDIMKGQAPDMVFGLDVSTLENYQRRGLLTDLMAFWKGDSSIHNDDYLPLLFLPFQNGSMPYLSLGFSIRGMLISQEYRGRLGEWKIADVKNLEDSLPKGIKLFDIASSQQSLLRDSLMIQITDFIDYSQGTVSLQNSDFQEILLFAKSHGKQSSSWDPTRLERFQNGQVLTESANILTPFSFREGQGLLDHDLDLIGYPGSGIAPAIHFWDTCAILNSSPNPDVCWEFLSLFQSSTYQSYNTRPSLLTREMYMSLRYDLLALQLENARQAVGYASGSTFGTTSFPPPLSEEQSQNFMQTLLTSTKIEREENAVINIILEEAEGYFTDQKSLEQVIYLMENRIKTLFEEQ